MAHIIRNQYNQQGVASTWNNATYDIIPTGFYTACTLTKISDIEVQVSAFTAHIQDSVQDLSVRIENTASESGIAVDSTNVWVVARLTWVNSSANDFQILGVAVGDILATDLIIAECQFGGATLTGFDYTSQSISILKDNGDEVRNFQNLTEKTTIVDNDTFIINDSADSNNPKNVKQSTVIEDVLSDITNQSAKTSFVDADEFIMNDSADSNAPKKITGENVIAGVLGDITNTSAKAGFVDADEFIINDSADSNAPKKVTGENIITTVLGDINTQTAKTSFDKDDYFLINDSEDSNAVKSILGSYLAGIETYATGTSTYYNYVVLRYSDGTQWAYGHTTHGFAGDTSKYVDVSITSTYQFTGDFYGVASGDQNNYAVVPYLNGSIYPVNAYSFRVYLTDISATARTGSYIGTFHIVGRWY